MQAAGGQGVLTSGPAEASTGAEPLRAEMGLSRLCGSISASQGTQCGSVLTLASVPGSDKANPCTDLSSPHQDGRGAGAPGKGGSGLGALPQVSVPEGWEPRVFLNGGSDGIL